MPEVHSAGRARSSTRCRRRAFLPELARVPAATGEIARAAAAFRWRRSQDESTEHRACRRDRLSPARALERWRRGTVEAIALALAAADAAAENWSTRLSRLAEARAGGAPLGDEERSGAWIAFVAGCTGTTSPLLRAGALALPAVLAGDAARGDAETASSSPSARRATLLRESTRPRARSHAGARAAAGATRTPAAPRRGSRDLRALGAVPMARALRVRTFKVGA